LLNAIIFMAGHKPAFLIYGLILQQFFWFWEPFTPT